MEDIKEAFSKVKEDINYIWNHTLKLEEKIDNLSNQLELLNEKLSLLGSHNQNNTSPTIQHINPTHKSDNPTHNDQKDLFKPLKGFKLSVSTGNEGVPTDKQTNRQTTNTQNILSKGSHNQENSTSFNKAYTLINEIESIKKNLTHKLRRLTDQEFIVFSMVYQFDEELGYSDYKMISSKLNLSESSIRDYIGRLVRKGIPIEKEKINNKQVLLHISKDFKKMAPLNQLISLR